MQYQAAEKNQKHAVLIGTTAWRALLEEVYTTPKPGLVDSYSCGAHRDMDVHTFEKSAEALQPWFIYMAEQGCILRGTPEELFRAVRRAGIAAEQAMYRATDGVNTHKGLIFSLGIFCAAAGRCIQEKKQITLKNLIQTEQQMTKQILIKELQEISGRQPVSNGERNLQRYGSAGIRGEALMGYPSITRLALPVMKQGIAEKQDWNRVKLQTLLTLMSRVEDSNVLSRQNPAVLTKMHQEAERFLVVGGAYAERAVWKLMEMDWEYTERNISPGGCADLLAVTIFLNMLTEEYGI